MNDTKVNINTGKPDNTSDTYEKKKDQTIPLEEGRPNYPEQTEMDADEVRIEQNQDQDEVSS